MVEREMQEGSETERERERQPTERKKEGKREKGIITRSVFSHLHSIPDGWAKSQLHFCALVKQGYYLNNSLLSKGKRREALSLRPGLLYITRIPLVCDTIPKLEMEASKTRNYACTRDNFLYSYKNSSNHCIIKSIVDLIRFSNPRNPSIPI